MSRQFLDSTDSFWIVRTVWSRQFCQDSFGIVWTIFGLSGQFLDCPDSFWIVQTVSSLWDFGKFGESVILVILVNLMILVNLGNLVNLLILVNVVILVVLMNLVILLNLVNFVNLVILGIENIWFV